jgi:hypothetical protein
VVFKYNSERLHPGREEKGQQPQATDPAKKLRNLKKKLRDIEALEAKVIFFSSYNKYRTVPLSLFFRKLRKKPTVPYSSFSFFLEFIILTQKIQYSTVMK